MGVDNQALLQHIRLHENGSLYPLPLSSSSSTSSEITDSSATHGISQDSSSTYPSKMSTTSISSDASVSSNDNTATNNKYNYTASVPSLVANNIPTQIFKVDEKTSNIQSKHGNTANQLISTGIGDSLFSQAMTGIIITFSLIFSSHH